MPQLRPGTRVYDHADFELGVVIKKDTRPGATYWWWIALDEPTVDGEYTVPVHEDDLEIVDAA